MEDEDSISVLLDFEVWFVPHRGLCGGEGGAHEPASQQQPSGAEGEAAQQHPQSTEGAQPSTRDGVRVHVHQQLTTDELCTP